MYSYFCQPIYNICNPTQWNIGMTLANQLTADTFAKMPLYNVQTVDYSQIGTLQGGSGNINSIFESIMKSTMERFQYQMNNGGINYGGFNFGNIFSNNTTTTTTTTLSSEEAVAKEKFTKLNNLLSVYKSNYTISDYNTRADYYIAKNKASGDTWVQAYDKLVAVYKKLNTQDPKGLKATLTLLDQNLNNDAGDPIAQNYKTKLANGGYDYTSTKVTGAPKVSVNIGDLHTDVLVPEVATGKNKPSKDYYPELPLSTSGNDNNILAVLGAWNNTYGKTKSGKERSIIRIFVDKVNESGKKYSDNECSEYITANIKPFTDALKHKGEYAADNLKYISETESNHLKALSLAINTDIEKIQASGKNKATLTSELNNLVSDFDKLYVALRLAEAKNAQEAIKQDYGFMNDIATDDTDIVDTSIVNNTKEDLKAEGFTEADITGSGVDVEAAGQEEDPPPANEGGNTGVVITKENILENGYTVANKVDTMAIKNYYMSGKHDEVSKYNLDVESFENVYKKGNKYYVFGTENDNAVLVELTYNPNK